jgi:flagella basal body P-ring formation protein FlgA
VNASRSIIPRLFAGALAALILAASLAVPVAQPVSADEARPVLREQIKVHSDLVTLGDIFENAGPASDTAVFRSPDLGTRGHVGAERVAEAARRHGLHWDNPVGVERVTVERPSRVVGLEEIRQAIARRAVGELGVADVNDLSVTLERRAKPFQVSARLSGPLAVKRLRLDPRSGGFEATVGFDGNEQAAPDAPEKSYRGRVRETMKIAVPARAIERGETIASGDVEMKRVPVSRVRGDVALSREALAGMAAKRDLPAGQPVRERYIEPPRLVRRNELVTIVYETPGLTLKAQGRAKADGGKGAVVHVLNTRSNRTIQAVVRGPGVVVVESASGGQQVRGAASPADTARNSISAPHSVR